MTSLWLPPSKQETQADSIRDRYRKSHSHCPKCGSKSVSITCVGYIWIDELHRDENAASCACGWSGIVHDLTDGTVRILPNAVKQTRPTNCFQACVATVLCLPIDEVPEACDGAKWDWDAFQDWLALRGLQAIEIYFGNGGTIYPVRKPVLCILTGNSPRGQREYEPGKSTSGLHAVVAELTGLEGFSLLHDPYPSEEWIGEPTHATFFVSI